MVGQHDLKRKANWKQVGSKDKRWMNDMGFRRGEDNRWWNSMTLSERKEQAAVKQHASKRQTHGRQVGDKDKLWGASGRRGESTNKMICKM